MKPLSCFLGCMLLMLLIFSAGCSGGSGDMPRESTGIDNPVLPDDPLLGGDPSNPVPPDDPLLGGGSYGAFTLQRYPESMRAIAGQRCVFLTTFTEPSVQALSNPVMISAQASSIDSLTITPPSISVDQVSEITVVPSAQAVGTTIPVSITGFRDQIKQRVTASMEVIPGADGIEAAAREYRGRFVQWLAVNRPEFRITPSTRWTGTIVSPDTVIVSYYLFFSEEWEMGISWHVMVAPYDWAVMYLRPRSAKTTPTYGLRIESFSSGDTPREVEPPAQVYR